jgi:hypothetical protein
MSEFMLDHVPAAFRDFLAPVGINKRCRTVGARDRQAILRPTVRASQARYILDLLPKCGVGQNQKNQSSIQQPHYRTPRRDILKSAPTGRPEDRLVDVNFRFSRTIELLH